MVYVSYAGAAVQDPELNVIVDVAVIDVRRIIGEVHRLRFHCRRQGVRFSVARPLTSARWRIERGSSRTRSFQTRVRWLIDEHRRVADGPGTQEKLFKLAVNTVAHRTDTDAVGIDF